MLLNLLDRYILIYSWRGDSLRFSDESSTDKSSLLIDGAQYSKSVTRERRRFAIFICVCVDGSEWQVWHIIQGVEFPLTSHLGLTHTNVYSGWPTILFRKPSKKKLMKYRNKTSRFKPSYFWSFGSSLQSHP